MPTTYDDNTFGMTPQGFVPKRLSDILSSITNKVKSITDPKTGEQPFMNESADSIFGQMSQIISEELAICWEAAYMASQQFNPANASGATLRSLVQLEGITPSYGAKTQLRMKMYGTAGTVIPAGSIISSEDDSQTYITVENATIGDNGTVYVNANCTETGPNDPAWNTIFVIKTPVYGWTKAENYSTVSVGANADTDTELHIKQEKATSSTSYRQVDAIEAGLMNVDGVKFARLYVNKTLTTDDNSIPGKTIAPVVVGGTDEDVAEALRLKCGTLDNFYGTTTVSYTGPLGDTQEVKFSRPAPVVILMNIVISLTENSTFQESEIDKIKQAIVDYAQYDQSGLTGFPPGSDIIRTRLYTPINSIPGFKVDTLEIGKVDGIIAEQDVAINWNEIGSFSTSNITVTIDTE